MTILTDDELVRLYEQATQTGFPPGGLPKLKVFLTMLLDTLPSAGHIDENNDVAFDAFMLAGSDIRSLLERPSFEVTK